MKRIIAFILLLCVVGLNAQNKKIMFDLSHSQCTYICGLRDLSEGDPCLYRDGG